MGEYVSDAERAQMEALAAEREDAPIEDPAERAETVAKELRRRGLWAYEELRLAVRHRLPHVHLDRQLRLGRDVGEVVSPYDPVLGMRREYDAHAAFFTVSNSIGANIGLDQTNAGVEQLFRLLHAQRIIFGGARDCGICRDFPLALLIRANA